MSHKQIPPSVENDHLIQQRALSVVFTGNVNKLFNFKHGTGKATGAVICLARLAIIVKQNQTYLVKDDIDLQLPRTIDSPWPKFPLERTGLDHPITPYYKGRARAKIRNSPQK
jgi:hypothetical protein